MFWSWISKWLAESGDGAEKHQPFRFSGNPPEAEGSLERKESNNDGHLFWEQKPLPINRVDFWHLEDPASRTTGTAACCQMGCEEARQGWDWSDLIIVYHPILEVANLNRLERQHLSWQCSFCLAERGYWCFFLFSIPESFHYTAL